MIGLLAMAAAVAATAPGYVTGNKLYSVCQTAPDRECLAFVEGVSDTDAAIQSSGIIAPIFCPSPHVTAGQERDVVLKFLHDNPALRDRGASSLVGGALQDAFLCPK